MDKVRNKKLLFTFLFIYLLGFVVLSTIGDAINENGLIITGLIAPLLSLSGIIGMVLSLYYQKDSK